MYIGQWFDRQFSPVSNGLRPSSENMLDVRRALTSAPPPPHLQPYAGAIWMEVGMEWMRLNGLMKDYITEDER
jgi:hypothetical protein